MKINGLNQEPGIKQSLKLEKARFQFKKLLFDLQNRNLQDGLVISINKFIDEINSSSISGENIRKVILIKKIQNKIIKLLVKEGNLVPKNYYKNLWLSIGMATIGIPFGVLLGTSLGNMAFMGLGLPIGMVIGIAVGVGKDKKALSDGRQLDIEI